MRNIFQHNWCSQQWEIGAQASNYGASQKYKSLLPKTNQTSNIGSLPIKCFIQNYISGYLKISTFQKSGHAWAKNGNSNHCNCCGICGKDLPHENRCSKSPNYYSPLHFCIWRISYHFLGVHVAGKYDFHCHSTKQHWLRKYPNDWGCNKRIRSYQLFSQFLSLLCYQWRNSSIIDQKF